MPGSWANDYWGAEGKESLARREAKQKALKETKEKRKALEKQYPQFSKEIDLLATGFAEHFFSESRQHLSTNEMKQLQPWDKQFINAVRPEIHKWLSEERSLSAIRSTTAMNLEYSQNYGTSTSFHEWKWRIATVIDNDPELLGFIGGLKDSDGITRFPNDGLTQEEITKQFRKARKTKAKKEGVILKGIYGPEEFTVSNPHENKKTKHEHLIVKLPKV